ncbi:MAG: M16 family metallopeptidase, partial [Polyangiales bacterium]
PGIVAYYTLVRVGSRDEVEEGHSGFAHLFEHMMFRGTEQYPQDVYEQTIQSFGADNNAFTTQDYTMYTITAPSDVLSEVVKLEADRFRRLSYDEEQFKTETGAVLGEYNKSASSPFLKMWEALSEMAFERHTYGHTTLGYLEDIEAMPDKYDYSKRFFERFYTPDNTTLIVAGDVEHDRLLELVEQHYGGWQGERDQPRIPKERSPRKGESRHIEWEGSSPPRMFVGYRTPSFDGANKRGRAREKALRETAALQIVHGLAFDPSAPLYQQLVVDEQKLLDLSSWKGSFSRDPHLMMITSVLKPGTDFEPILGAIQQQMDTIAAGEVAAERIEAVKSNLRYSLLTDLETPDDVASLVGEMIAVGGSLEALDAYIEALRAVTPEDVAEVAGDYLTEKRRFVVTLAPKGEADAEAEGGTGAGEEE